MKVIIFAFLFLSAGVVYANYYLAQQEEQNTTRFIVSQVEAQKDMEQKGAVANILSNDRAASQKPGSSRVIKPNVVADVENTQNISFATGSKALTSQDFQASTVRPSQSTLSTQPFSLVKSVPGIGVISWPSGKSFSFEFNEEVDIESFFDSFILTPSVDGKFSGEMNYGATKNILIVNAVPKLMAGTKYTVTLKNGIKSFDKTKTLSAPVSFMVDIK